MKRTQLIKYLKEHNCCFHREGANHTLFVNKETGLYSAIPRHSEIKDILAIKICKELGIPKIK
jgi:mRNA interferase HicA